MKIFNKTRSTKLQAHWPPIKHVEDEEGPIVTIHDQTLIESLPGQTVDVPDELGTNWLAKWGHIVITDEEANRQVAVSKAAIEERDRIIKELSDQLVATKKVAEAALAKPAEKVDGVNEAAAQLAAKDQEIAELKALLDKATAPAGAPKADKGQKAKGTQPTPDAPASPSESSPS